MNSGKIIGYIRVSTYDQNPARQLEGVEVDKIFTDKASGKDTNRPELAALLNYVREGDTIIIHSIDRLARNLTDLKRLIYDLTSKSITIHFLKEKLAFTADESPMSNLLLSVMGAFAEFERALIRERQIEGILKAKKKGLYKGRKPIFTKEQIKHIKDRIKNGESKTKIAKSLSVTTATIYNYLNKQE